MLRKRYIQLTIGFLFTGSFALFSQQNLTGKLDSAIMRTGREKLPGFAVRVLKDNKTIYEYACGQANIRKRIPLSVHSIVNSASVSKQFTAYGILRLEQEGKLRLDDNIRTYLPELPVFSDTITIRQLLAHTSGLRDYPDFISLLNESSNYNLSYERLIDFLNAQHELNFPPGTHFCYSNTGYMLLARILEVRSGMSYASYMQRYIFDPLHMDDTYVNEGVITHQSDGTTNYKLNAKKTRAKRARSHKDIIGATGICTSISDLSHWDSIFYLHESDRHTDSILAAMEKSFTLNDGTPCHYGGGLLLKHYRGRKVIEHSGGWGEYLTQYRRFPEEGITVMVVTNSMLDSPFEICDKICNHLLSFPDTLIPEVHPPSCVPLDLLEGIYLSEDNFIRQVCAALPGKIILGNHASNAKATYYLQRSECLDTVSTLFFEDSCGNRLVFTVGRDTSFLWSQSTYFETQRTYYRFPPVIPQENLIQAQHYYAPEPDMTVRIRYSKQRGEYVLILYPWLRFSLKPIANGVYQLENETYLIRFKKNGFVFGNDWIYNLTFFRRD